MSRILRNLADRLASVEHCCYGIWVATTGWVKTRRKTARLRRLRWAEREIAKFEADWYALDKCQCALCKEQRGQLQDALIFFPSRVS